MPRRSRLLLALLAPAALVVAPAGAAAASCPLPNPSLPDADFSTILDVEGNVSAQRAGGYLQIPFDVPAGTTAVRVRYSFDQPGGACSLPQNVNTLDVGVYGPRQAGESVWGVEESRGWSGSSVRDLAIAVNGFSDQATYESARKALVHGRTTRAYRPGAIPAGRWAVELGLAFIAPSTPADSDGVRYRVLVEATSSPDWSGDPYAPSGYSAAPARPAAGWYAGDVHAHGEMEPGNAPISQTLGQAFTPLASGGAGLDFVALVNHNNDVGTADLAAAQAANPGKLIIPGTEMTTYRGHHNRIGSGPLQDFRAGAISQPSSGAPPGAELADSDLTQVRGPVPPSAPFAAAQAAGDWTQINHPTTFRDLPSFCRGCAWGYDDAETDFSKVDAIEIQTGPAAVPAGAPAQPNPFTAQAIAFYERALAGGARIAAVGSSDDHQGGAATGATDSPVGRASTMVYASELSEAGVTAAVKARRTYVKPFGNDGPDISLTAAVPGRAPAMIGDAVSGPSAELTATVSGATRSGRPGTFKLLLLRDGAPIETVPFTGDAISRTFTAPGAGRYSLEVVRSQLGADYVEAYSSPIFFSLGGPSGAKPSNRFRILRVVHDRRRGTARLIVRVPGPGTLRLRGRAVAGARRTPAGARRVRLPVRPRRALDRRLARSGSVRLRARVRYAPTGGTPRARSRRLRLLER